MKQAPAAVSHVFVYGTLRRGGSNDINRLTPAPRRVGAATVAGMLYDLGVYPGATLGGQGRILGEVYAVEPALVRVLDEIEEVWPQQSDEYRRRMLMVEVGGRLMECLVYEINPRYIVGRPAIASGDWIDYVARR